MDQCKLWIMLQCKLLSDITVNHTCVTTVGVMVQLNHIIFPADCIPQGLQAYPILVYPIKLYHGTCELKCVCLQIIISQ